VCIFATVFYESYTVTVALLPGLYHEPFDYKRWPDFETLSEFSTRGTNFSVFLAANIDLAIYQYFVLLLAI
jgi:hypothetical protein